MAEKPWEVTIHIKCEGSTFMDSAKQIKPEYGLADLLEAFVDELREGLDSYDMNGFTLFTENNEPVGLVVVTGPHTRPDESRYRRD